VRLFDAQAHTDCKVRLSTAMATIWILNDDDPGKISFESLTVPALDTDTSVTIKMVRQDGYDGNLLAFVKTVEGTGKENEDFVGLPEDSEVHFPDHVSEASIDIKLIPNPNKPSTNFSVMITAVEPEAASIGDNMCTVIISNDKDYQKLMQDVVEMMDAEMGKYQVGTSSWGDQFHDAMNMGSDDPDEVEFMDYLMHFLSFYWKVMHAIIPPTDYYGGWATFWISLMFIGGITVWVGDVAKMFGCCLGIPSSITAITFVALGTSLPDTFASMEATVSDDSADAAITNVTGSNSVNVFLGLGLPWTMAAFYHLANGTTFRYEAGTIVFSVLVYFVFAILCLLLLVYRRTSWIGGELGGPKMAAYCSSAFLVFSWFAYVLLSILKEGGTL